MIREKAFLHIIKILSSLLHLFYSFSLSSGQFLWAISKLSSLSLSDRFAALPNSLKYKLYSSFNATHKFRLPLSLICLLIGNSKDEEFLPVGPLKISPFPPSHRFALAQSLQRNSVRTNRIELLFKL